MNPLQAWRNWRDRRRRWRAILAKKLPTQRYHRGEPLRWHAWVELRGVTCWSEQTGKPLDGVYVLLVRGLLGRRHTGGQHLVKYDHGEIVRAEVSEAVQYIQMLSGLPSVTGVKR